MQVVEGALHDGGEIDLGQHRSEAWLNTGEVEGKGYVL